MKKLITAIFTITIALSGTANCEQAVVEDSFDSAELSKKWSAAKGSWKIVDGKLKGTELAADEHAAVLTYREKHTNAKVQISFQLAGSNGFHLSFNHPKGHLYRIVISNNQVRLNTDKDKKDPTSKPIVLAKKKANFEQGKTYTLTCDTQGDTVKVEAGDVKLEGTHELLTKPKTGYRLVLKGDGVLFDDFKILSQQ